MSYARCYRGLASGTEYPMDQPMNLDPVDQRPVEIVIDVDRLKHEQPAHDWYHPERQSMWRFGSLLALDYDDPDDHQYIVSLGEGHTPMLPYDDFGSVSAAGLSLQMKDEGQHWQGYGGNPTYSFKDRGMVMTVSMAKRYGIERLVVPTQGNAGDSLSEYALHAGIDCAVIMPEDTPMPIQGKVAAYAARYPGHSIDFVEGTIREAGELMKQRYLPEGYFNVATFQEPGWRIEGKKTLGLEIAEPGPGKESWGLPDVIIYPTGGGTGVLGMWKAFHELEALGLIGRQRPRLYCVQSEVTSPVVNAITQGNDDTTPVDAGQTLAVGLNVPGGVGHFRVLDIIRQSDGSAITVSESQIAAVMSQVWNDKRWWLCPEGAACLAAIEPLLESNRIQSGERVVVINTGSAEKYLPELRHLMM